MSNEKFKVKFGLAVGDTAATIDATTGEGIFAEGDNGQITVGKGVGDNGRIEIGLTGRTVAGTPYVDFHSSASSVDYDVRMLASGPTTPTGSGEGTLTITAVNTNLSGDIQLGSNDIKASDGAIAETLVPITGQSPNVVTPGNLVKGAIRNAPTEAGGNIFSFSAAGTGGLTRGISIDNSIATTQRPGVVLRSYGGGLAGGNPQATFITETAKGTAAVPAGLANGNSLGSWLASGYADTIVGGSSPGWATDTTGSNLASVGFITTEAFTSGTTNLGTQCSIRTNPTGLGNVIQTSMAINPQSTISRSDAFTWQNGKTGTTQTMALDVSGNLTTTGNLTVSGTGTSTIGGDLRINGGAIQNPGGTNAITLTSSNATTTIVGDNLNFNNAAGNNSINFNNTAKTITMNSGSIGLLSLGDVNIVKMGSTFQSAFVPGFKYTGLASSSTLTYNGTLFEMSARWKASSGTSTYAPPQTDWGMGAFQFSADNSTTGTNQLVAAQIRVAATENWDATHYGTKITLDANALGTGGGKQIASFSPETTTFKSDLLTLQNSAAVNLVGGKIVYGRQYIEAYSTVNQTNPVANAENLMSFNNTGISNGISIVTNGTTLTRITMSTAGIYNIQFSAQLNQTTGGAHNAFIWLKKNGTAVANTAGDTRVAGNGDRIMAAWNYIVSAAAGDYYELAWAADDTAVLLDYVAAAGVVPAVPSVILTVVPVGA